MLGFNINKVECKFKKFCFKSKLSGCCKSNKLECEYKYIKFLANCNHLNTVAKGDWVLNNFTKI